MDMDIKKLLLEELMKEMDDSVVGELKAKKAEPIAIVKEEKTEAIPASKLEDKMREVMGKAEVEPESGSEPESETPEVEEESDDEDMGGESGLMKKLMELKKAKLKDC